MRPAAESLQRARRRRRALRVRASRTTALVTGGAGFIGSHIAIQLARSGTTRRIVALDNLRRRGSELNLSRLRAAGVEFVHGDVRLAGDFASVESDLGLIVDCAADPSVLSGYSGARDLIGANLDGTVNCLELARRTGADLVFLSTSRVYPIARLNELAVVEQDTRFELDLSSASTDGISPEGVSERFSLEGIRSLYGATKLASELLLQEYAAMYGIRYVINRLGVVAGPGQMGKVEQGVFSLWMAGHYFGRELRYRGWGGTGKQVRDVLHVMDLADLVIRQLSHWDRIGGQIYNVGGGPTNSVSLQETTMLCRELTGRRVPVHSDPVTHPSDVRLYYSDNRRITADLGWRPTRSIRAIFTDLLEWFEAESARLEPLFTN